MQVDKQFNDSIQELKKSIDRHLKSAGAFQPLTESEEDNQAYIQELYTRGYFFYGNGKYSEATDFFKVLTQIDADSPHNWTGLAACLQMQKQYNEALIAYSTSLILDSTNVINFFHAANCCFASNHIKEGLEALAMAESLAQENPKYEGMLEQIGLLKEEWSSINLGDKDV